MEELCTRSPTDDRELRYKIETFLRDRSRDAVLGTRRMGRNNLVQETAEICGTLELSYSIYPDTSGKDVIIFDEWYEMEDVIKDILRKRSGVDIIYGQDLCHQVPAIARMKKN